MAHAPTNTKAPTVAAALAAPPDSHESDPSIEAPNATRIPDNQSAQIPQASWRAVLALTSSLPSLGPGSVPPRSCPPRLAPAS